MDKAKKKGITWGEAAKMVLECSSEPLNHKEILKAILDRNLKEVNLKFSQALACLNAMLHANSRTPSSLFVKVSGKGTSYLLNKNRTDLVDSTDTDSDSPGSSSNDTDTKDTGEKMSTQFTGILSGNTSSGSLPPISSILGSYHSQASSTSVTSSIECAIADSRLSSLIAPTPDPGRSALAKKRSIKPCFREGSSSKKPRVTFKLDNDKKVKNDRPARPPVKTKAELKYMGDDTAVSQNFIPPVLRPPMYPTHTVVKNSSSGYFGQKRHKKMSIAAQVKRSKEGQVDLVSPDSILSKINCKALMNLATFDLLPKHYQYQLVKLLPEVDREVGSKGEIKPTATAFSNEFITSAFESWKERLSEGEFTQEMSQKIQQEQEKVFNQDPWKTKHFESFWGEKFLENERYISPVERSHQIMEQVQVEWQKEQERLAKEKLENEKLEKEREKLKEAENTDLSAPNKLQKTDQDGAKNLTSKQKAALVRQQKLAKAKSVTNKAHKKTSEGKSSKSGKTSSKNGNEGAVKEKTKPKTKTKQTKVKPATNLENSDGLGLLDTVVDVVGVSVTEPDDVTSTTTAAVETAVEQKASPTEAKPPSLTESTSVLPSIPVVSEQPAIKEKPAKKPSKKKKETKSVNSALGFPCMCVLKPMVMCRRCGAFCHSDCINPMSICAACVA